MLSVSYAAQSLKSSISKNHLADQHFPHVRGQLTSTNRASYLTCWLNTRASDRPSIHLDSAYFGQSRLTSRTVLRRIDKLTNLRPLFLDIRKMLFSQLLIDFDLFLGGTFLAGANISLT
jgi:hypothetical protein